MQQIRYGVITIYHHLAQPIKWYCLINQAGVGAQSYLLVQERSGQFVYVSGQEGRPSDDLTERGQRLVNTLDQSHRIKLLQLDE